MNRVTEFKKHSLCLSIMLALSTLSINATAAEFKPNTTAQATTPAVKTQVDTTDLQNRIERLERMADNPVLLQLSRRLADQQREIQGLYDQIDRLQFDLKNFKEQAGKRYRDSDARLTELEADRNPGHAETMPNDLIPEATSVPLTPAILPVSVTDASLPPVDKTPQAAEPATPQVQVKPEKVSPVANPTAIKTRPATDEEKAAYQAAFDLMKKKQYAESIQAFEDFRKSYPESILSSNAAYWAGEGYLISGEKDKAIAAFDVVQTLYPDSSKKPAAMLRQADTLRDTNQKSQAKALYESLIKQHPDSTIAAKAKTRIEGLVK
ncbi:tol-pal system protein YbgF [Thiosulfativibrio zosterae]|uniref:Cell division coordinator CpoB n=1 Tax=Thiosulfativibrio zosterae TaxID=2675053 RepID=A0A6F8PP21_9GAMM|nr:tol-pal system protein YbgF [Thiosulfativibrio zosterae]BBP43740.1 tol-pal system protein YbgF [Thiosulfativibrio zosterae]